MDLAEIRARIERLPVAFQFIRPIETEMNGIKRQTWLLEYEGAQFVFVEGQKQVTLGWDSKTCPLGEQLLADLEKEFLEAEAYYAWEAEETEADYRGQIAEAQKAGKDDEAQQLTVEMNEVLASIKEQSYDSFAAFLAAWNEQLDKCLSPVRTVDIGDMVVECDSRYLAEDGASMEEIIAEAKEDPFTLATEDEWEYLCNGGARTLFRWGDGITEALADIYQVGSALADENKASFLEKPNMLGLFIAYDSYKNEIIDNADYTKAGDGGSSLCGGESVVAVLPCYSAFYREPVSKRAHFSKNYHCYRRIIRL